MRILIVVACLLSMSPLLAFAATTAPEGDWRQRVDEAMPMLGHRNWILVVDSAYPLQSTPGVETIETGASQLDVVHAVLGSIDRSIHVRPVISMDAELPYLQEADAPGVNRYRDEIKDLLADYSIASVPHDKLIATVEETAKHFNVLILKTTMSVPYTSVFIRLDCKYWGDDAEKRLRARMASGAPAPAAK